MNLATRYPQTDVPGSHLFHHVRLIKNDKIILKQHPSFGRFLHSVQEGEKESVIQDHDVGGKDLLSGALKKAGVVVLCKV